MFRKNLFNDLLKLRNVAVHHPAAITEADFAAGTRKLEQLEERMP